LWEKKHSGGRERGVGGCGFTKKSKGKSKKTAAHAGLFKRGGGEKILGLNEGRKKYRGYAR